MTSETRQVIIGTAGHVDHGKSSLVKALTGIDPDMLPEEKTRGMTIELGFVFMENPGLDRQIVFIDVPGHEGLVKTMVAGASNIDAAILVIAADEGIMPQTAEHFDILNLLGIKNGFIALTKTDLVNHEQIDKVTAEIRTFTAGSFLEDAPVIPVSSRSGEGLVQIRTVLSDIASRTEERNDTGIFRMPIDRIFTARGFGTVVAGTILSGTVTIGDTIEIFPERITSKVRGIQVHKHQVQKSGIGMRTGLNIPEVKKEQLRRGQSAAVPDSLFPTNRIDAQLYLLKDYRKELKNRTRLRFHTGTEEIICRLILLDRETLLPGEKALVQFFLESPLAALPKDRFVIRTFSPLKAIGGGIILDVAPKKRKRFDQQSFNGIKKLEGGIKEIAEEIILKNRFLPLGIAEIARQAGKKEEKVKTTVEEIRHEKKVVGITSEGKISSLSEQKYLHITAYEELSEILINAVRDFLNQNPYRLTMPFAHLQSYLAKITDKQVFGTVFGQLEINGMVFRKNGGVGLPGYRIKLKPQEQKSADRIIKIFLETGFSAPSEEEVRKETGMPPEVFKNVMDALVEQQLLVRLSEKVTYHNNWLKKAEEIVTDYLKQNQSITISELRDKLNLSRKYTQAILEYFDAAGLIKRDGDKHILADRNF